VPNLKFDEVDSFLCNKLHCRRENSSHTKYLLPRPLDRALPFVLPLHHQHTAQEVKEPILREIAGVLGVPLKSLLDACKCDYGDMVLYSSLVVSQLERLVDGCVRDPPAFARLLEMYCSSVRSFIGGIRAACRTSGRHRRDAILLSELRTRLAAVQRRCNTQMPASSRSAIESAVRQLDEFILEHHEKKSS
jgi:hypothetical protein